MPSKTTALVPKLSDTSLSVIRQPTPPRTALAPARSSRPF